MGRVSLGRSLCTAAVASAVAWTALGVVPDSASAQSEGTGYFSDDDGSVHERALDALAAEGILAGIECGDGLICPGEPLKRWEMAVWLVRVLDGVDPDGTSEPRFVDVDAEAWWSPFMERFFELGVTLGCATEPARYCPEGDVTRAQMATFLVRAFKLDPAPSAGFTDISEGGGHGSNIDALANAGITAGCSTDPLRYCPRNSVTRAQMATFLWRAENPDWRAESEQASESTPPDDATDGDGALLTSAQFTAVDVGDSHACGLRLDGSVVCWGANPVGRIEAPAGEFLAVSAGGLHSCGLLTDGTVACWGDDREGQSEAPAGEFQAVSAGWLHSCGLLADGAVACWGANQFGQSDAPSGSFRSVSAGGYHACGVRPDSTVACWGSGDEGQSDPPEGSFSNVDAGGNHTCGVRTDSTVTCWGINDYGESDAPTGRFDSVSPGWWHTCGLRVDRTVVCWGYGDAGATHASSGEFAAVGAGVGYSCGLRVDGIVVCWGDATQHREPPSQGGLETVSAGRGHNCAVNTTNEAVCWGTNSNHQAEAPGGEFTAVVAGATHSCGLSVEKAIVCWGDRGSGLLDAPGGEFNALAAGDWHSCGLRADEAIVCWGANGSGESDAPEGTFSHVGSGTWHSCAVRTDGTPVCWGNNSNGQAEPPEGEFVSIGGGSWHSCGLRSDRTVLCWGAGGAGQTRPPAGEFVAVASGHLHSCSIRVDGSVECWGSNEFGQLDAPDGEFAAIDVGERHSCAIGVDGNVECWGLAVYGAPPSNVTLVSWMDRADPGNCRVRGIRAGITAGFPLPWWAEPSMGTVRVAVLFVDFADTPASHSTEDEAVMGLPFAERYLETVSYGQLDIEFEPFHRWLRAEQGHSHYLSPQGMLEHAIDKEAVRLADPDVDFEDYDLLMVVAPSSHFHGGNAVGEVGTDEGFVSTLRINVFPREQPVAPVPWGSIAAHEIVHNLGLADLYAYDDSLTNRAETPADRTWVDVVMGLMAMRAHFMTSSQDTRLAYDWLHPDGYRSTAYLLSLHALEMLSWSRWQLGWLDASQVVCLNDDETTVALGAVADPDGGTAMAAVPLSDHEALVIESRRRIGYDAGLDHREPDGTTTTLPALVTEGVLVYVVDASLHTGERALRVVGDSGDGLVQDYPVLTVGQTVTVRGYRITVVSDDGSTHTVTITKTSEG